MSVDIFRKSDSPRMNWATTIVMGLFHIGTIAALFMFNWRAVGTAIVLYWISTGWGISLGYHRLHTHRSYKAPLWLEHFFAVCGTLTLEGGPISWMATHRVHHQKSDQPDDPHSPRDGGWWAHAGWIILGETKHNNTRLMSRYAPDLAKDQFYVLRTLVVKNQVDKGPKRGAAEATAPPAQAPSSGAKPKEPGIAFIVGTEHVDATARIEIVKFAIPENPAR